MIHLIFSYIVLCYIILHYTNVFGFVFDIFNMFQVFYVVDIVDIVDVLYVVDIVKEP